MSCNFHTYALKHTLRVSSSLQEIRLWRAGNSITASKDHIWDPTCPSDNWLVLFWALNDILAHGEEPTWTLWAWSSLRAIASGQELKTWILYRQRAHLQISAAIKKRQDKHVVCSKTLIAKKGQGKRVLKRCQDILDFSIGRARRPENGILEFTCSRDLNDADTFHFWERYDGNTNLGRHNSLPEYVKFMEGVSMTFMIWPLPVYAVFSFLIGLFQDRLHYSVVWNFAIRQKRHRLSFQILEPFWRASCWTCRCPQHQFVNSHLLNLDWGQSVDLLWWWTSLRERPIVAHRLSKSHPKVNGQL